MKPYRIPQLAKPYTDYDMIQRHTELPPFSDGRSHLLYIFLSYGSAGEDRNKELYTLVTGLVQLALDTHESIEHVSDNPASDPMRSRQLKVLAGDYFSSWFYHLLAKNGQIGMVGTLSSAIADFNVLKARLYSKMEEQLLSSEQYLRHSVQLNMRLFLSFTPLIREELAGVWEQLLAEYSLCEMVCSELRRGNDPVSARDGYSYWRIMEGAAEEEKILLQSRELDLKDWKKLKMKYKCDTLLTDRLHQSVQSIQGLLQGIKDEHLISELSTALDCFLLQMKISGQAAVEG
ncbi:heptaprenyl diphosphate synthase [Paenibacillus sp. FSL R7-0273]|uniref:heptaprenyl diphosphate synthase component 1 n=1 Tax=Paenibacillus sp. FSL R7-0273 TaxID=1536772 RepID=UPI0004F8931B|nr:heptaprenyl diphosphate synthase component 1 [Paenibacillus sp. FSL R7-0273]AIQ48180.1 heptaprenyl diphosphate synthase [Paenibacillus sp. FSL R7-0273]OMF91945.1 heptaprenyl diphosphate synthase [Paenibacillus sp. FSL R7-0273]